MQLLRPEEVARILSCSRAAVYALKDAGKLPYCKIGGMIRFRPEDVQALISESLVTREERPRTPARVPRLKHLRA